MKYVTPKITHKGELKQFTGSPYSGNSSYYDDDVNTTDPLPGRGTFG